jgi:isoleucyl-tRNA synthetase
MEHIHRALCDGQSVHLQDWPQAEAFQTDVALVEQMDLARAVCSAAASIRTAKNLRNRLPLRTLTVAHQRNAILQSLRDVIADEANVKDVVLVNDPARFGAEVLVVNPRLVGKRLGKAMQAVLAEARAGEWKRLPDGAVEVASHRIEAGEYELRFAAKEGFDAASFDGNAGVVVLDTRVDAALEREGLARDFIRLVQVARKDAGLNVADRIRIEVKAGEIGAAAIAEHLDAVKQETLAVAFRRTEGTPGGFLSEAKLGDEAITLGIRAAGRSQ